jgi:hypothetical protein
MDRLLVVQDRQYIVDLNGLINLIKVLVMSVQVNELLSSLVNEFKAS